MKTRIVTEAIAVFFMLFCNGITAYAAPEDVELTDIDLFMEEAPPILDTEDVPPIVVIEYPAEEARPFTPSGTGTVTDTATNEDGKEFYTIITPDEHIFYLVIDRQRGQENVYFLNAVTVADLLSLAEIPDYPVTMPTEQPPASSLPAVPEALQPMIESPEPEQQQGNSNTGTIIFVAVFIVIGGVAGWYFKIYRPKQQGKGLDEAEYIPESDIDSDTWDDDDAAPWDEDES